MSLTEKQIDTYFTKHEAHCQDIKNLEQYEDSLIKSLPYIENLPVGLYLLSEYKKHKVLNTATVTDNDRKVVHVQIHSIYDDEFNERDHEQIEKLEYHYRSHNSLCSGVFILQIAKETKYGKPEKSYCSIINQVGKCHCSLKSKIKHILE